MCDFKFERPRSKICKIRHTVAFLAFHFPVISLVTLKEPWNLTGCFVSVFVSYWKSKRWDLKQKVMRFGNKSHCWEPIRLQAFFFPFLRQESPIIWLRGTNFRLIYVSKKTTFPFAFDGVYGFAFDLLHVLFFLLSFAHRCQSSWFSEKHSLAWYSASFEVCNMWSLSRVWKNNTAQKKT